MALKTIVDARKQGSLIGPSDGVSHEMPPSNQPTGQELREQSQWTLALIISSYQAKPPAPRTGLGGGHTCPERPQTAGATDEKSQLWSEAGGGLDPSSAFYQLCPWPKDKASFLHLQLRIKYLEHLSL